MLIDLRYHIVSLIAVFLSLGAGILIGSVLLPGTTLLEKQKTMITRLEQDFMKIREENKRIQTSQEYFMRFQKGVVPGLVQGKLAGKKILIIETNKLTPSYDSAWLIPLLKQAGAEVVGLVTLHRQEFSGNRQKEIMHHLGLNVPETFFKNISMRLAIELMTGGDMRLFNYLMEKNALDTTRKEMAPPDAVLLVGGSAKDQDTSNSELDIFLIRGFNNSLRVVGAEPSFVKTSFMPIYQKEGISTVDHVETPAGEVSVVYALAGMDGKFGLKKTAGKLLPVLTLEQTQP